MVYKNAKYAQVLKNGSNQNTIKSSNRSLVLEVLNSMGATSRTQLAKVTGLTKTSITNITTELIKTKIIREVGSEDTSVGRKPIMIEISNDSPCAIGLSINRDFVYASLVNLRGELLVENSYVYSRNENIQTFTEGIYSCCDDILEFASKHNKSILGIGIASIGPLDIKKGMILKPPNFKGLENIKIVEMLENKYNFTIRLNNDMCGGAIAEKLFGYGKQYINFVYCGVTNGIGAGVVINNKIYTGENGFAGEIGHISIDHGGKQCPCGNQGCLELYAGIPYIIEDVKSMLIGVNNSLLSSVANLRWLDIVDAANKGDKIAIGALKKTSHYLAIGFVTIVNIYDPQVIFLGHEIASAEGLLINEIQTELDNKIFSKEISKVKVHLSKFTDVAYKINGASILIGDYFAGEL